jgi:S1-C subfamily serine protease
MFQSLENEAFDGKLNRIENLEAEWTKDWKPIALSTHSAPAGKVSSALQSVVTVEASDGHGSGCIISSDGYIVTNYHVIADGLDTYPVHFHDGSVIEAQVVRYHPVYDLALLKVNAPDLLPFHLSLEEAIAVGEEAYALGTPYDIDLGASVTKGIISGKRKDATRTLIQTDVSISPGNSGGALINEQGTLLGIVNEKVLGMGVEGIGFAIPTYLLPRALKLEFTP